MSRILFLCDTFAPNVGGSEAVLSDMAEGVAADGHKVVVLTRASDLPKNLESAFDAALTYSIVRSRFWKRLFRAGSEKGGILGRIARGILIPFLFSRTLALGRFDLIVAGHIVPLGNIAAAAARMRGGRVLAVTYGEEVTMYSRGARMRRLLIDALRRADAVLCLTQDSATEIQSISGISAERIRVYPPPADPAIVDVKPEEIERIRSRYGLHGRRVLLTVGRLAPRKGFDMTLRSFGRLRDEFPELTYMIAGEGNQRKELEQLAHELGVSEHVIFTGSMALRGQYPLFHICDVFVMPNRTMPDGEREGYGIVFVEAGLAGKPVIGGRSGGAMDAVVDGETGIIVDPQNPDEIADAIRRLLLDAELARSMGEKGRARALQLNAPEATRRRFAAIIEGVLNEAGE